MKYAITGPAGRIFKVLDAATDGSVEITDEQAATVNSSEEPLFLIEGELKTIQEKFVAAMSPEAKAAYEAARNPVPAQIENWRARAVLEVEGLLPQVDTLIDALTGPEGVAVKTAWIFGASLTRNGATVQAIAAQLGLNDEQVDTLFRQAAALSI
jgi:hypothetical protein